MKSILVLTSLILVTIAAQAAPVTIEGVIADDLLNLSADLGAAEGALGKIYTEIQNVTCTKNVDGTDDYISCVLVNPYASMNGTPSSIEISTKDSGSSDKALRLRKILNQVLPGVEVKTSATRRTISVSSIRCKGTNAGHALDDVDYEPWSECELE